MADGQATTIFLPGDGSGLLGSLAGVVELLKDGGGNGSSPPAAAAPAPAKRGTARPPTA